MSILKKDLKAAAAKLGLETSGTKAAIQGRIKTFGYDGVTDKGRRRKPGTRPKHEDAILTKSKRLKMLATTQDQLRNHALVAWMVRKHLDYVSRFKLQFKTGNDALDAAVNSLFRWHARPNNFDISGRLGREEMFRLFELEKVAAGDAGLLKVDGNFLQAIESDLIAKPKSGWSTDEQKDKVQKLKDSGIIKDVNGRASEYCICNRGDRGTDLVFDQFADAGRMIFDAYWSRFASQDRGVSPLSTAINTIQDLGEAFEYNLVKAKMHALFGMAILRKTDGESEMGAASGATGETAAATEADDDSHLTLDPLSINILDMEPGDDVKTIESGTPSEEFVNGSYLFIQIAMLALDIPITCFDSRRSSFSGRIADLNEYEVSVDWKRTKSRYVRQEYSDWLIDQFWDSETREIAKLAKAAGLSIEQVQERVEWIPAGAPWLDKFKQVKGDEKAIELRLDNAIDAARSRGGDVFKNIEKQIAVEVYERDARAAAGLPQFNETEPGATPKKGAKGKP